MCIYIYIAYRKSYSREYPDKRKASHGTVPTFWDPGILIQQLPHVVWCLCSAGDLGLQVDS